MSKTNSQVSTPRVLNKIKPLRPPQFSLFSSFLRSYLGPTCSLRNRGEKKRGKGIKLDKVQTGTNLDNGEGRKGGGKKQQLRFGGLP